MILSAIATKPKSRSKDVFKGRHFEAGLIVQAVSWSLRYPLSYRDIEEPPLARGLEVDHSSVNRWVLAYAPLIERRLRPFRKPHCGSVRKAADRLNVAASAINRQILSLEAELDTPLFERMPGGLRLTASGEVLIAHVRDTLREHGRALGRMAALKGLQQGEVVIATMGGLAATQLGPALGEFRAAHPRVRLSVRVLTRDGIVAALLAGEADLGLAFNLPSHPRLYRAASFEHAIGAVMAPDHPLASRLSLRFADCLPHPLLLAERGMSLREATDQLVPPNVDLNPALETNSLELMRRMARTSPCVTFMCAFEVEEDLRAGQLAFVPIQGSPARQAVALVHRAAGPLDPVVSAAAAYLGTGLSPRLDEA